MLRALFDRLVASKYNIIIETTGMTDAFISDCKLWSDFGLRVLLMYPTADLKTIQERAMKRYAATKQLPTPDSVL